MYVQINVTERSNKKLFLSPQTTASLQLKKNKQSRT